MIVTERNLVDINEILITYGYSASARKFVWAVLEQEAPDDEAPLRDNIIPFRGLWVGGAQ